MLWRWSVVAVLERIPTGSNAAPPCDPGHGTKFAAALCCNSSLRTGCRQAERMPAANNQKSGAPMYSILVLICSTALSHADCQAKTAVDVVRGPTVDNPMMCAFNAQTMIARTDFVQGDGAEYVKVVCTRAKNADQWVAELKAREAAVQ
jgi:hypothetical protein